MINKLIQLEPNLTTMTNHLLLRQSRILRAFSWRRMMNRSTIAPLQSFKMRNNPLLRRILVAAVRKVAGTL